MCRLTQARALVDDRGSGEHSTHAGCRRQAPSEAWRLSWLGRVAGTTPNLLCPTALSWLPPRHHRHQPGRCGADGRHHGIHKGQLPACGGRTARGGRPAPAAGRPRCAGEGQGWGVTAFTGFADWGGVQVAGCAAGRGGCWVVCAWAGACCCCKAWWRHVRNDSQPVKPLPSCRRRCLMLAGG